jgi:hypothetical protein
MHKQKILLGTEFLLLCLVFPGIIIGFKLGMYMFSFLWAATLYCAVVDRFNFFNGFKEMWKWQAVNWTNMKPICVRFVLSVVGMYFFTIWYAPDRLFFLINERPQIIPYLLVLYPLISALPQEYIFCRFFFARYKPFFGEGIKMIVASAIIFAFAHVLFINPVAPTLSLLGGLIFAHTYWKTKSLALVTIEHGLYGNVIFLIGLGYYFYSGGISS